MEPTTNTSPTTDALPETSTDASTQSNDAPQSQTDSAAAKSDSAPVLTLSSEQHEEAKSIMTELHGFLHALSGDVAEKWNKLRALLGHPHA